MMDAPIVAYFSPGGGCTTAWVRTVLQTKREFLVAAYSFTSPEIARALVQIHKAGKTVQGIFCPSMAWSHGSQVGVLAAAGVPCFIDGAHHLFHDKFGVQDCRIVLSGSFNLTVSAEQSNAENLVIAIVPALARQYVANFRSHLEHSIPYTPKPVAHLFGLEAHDEDGARAEGD